MWSEAMLSVIQRWRAMPQWKKIAFVFLSCAPAVVFGTIAAVLGTFLGTFVTTHESYFRVDRTVKLSDFLTGISATAAASGFLYNLRKDRQLRRKEHADTIRKASATVIAKMERWKELTLRFFDEVQPAFVDADIAFTNGESYIEVRDKLWKDLSAYRIAVSQKIVDEQIEIAYADLLGYDVRVQELFSATLKELKLVEYSTHGILLDLTQDNVLVMDKNFRSTRLKDSEYTRQALTAQLGNDLRSTGEDVKASCELSLEAIIKPFRKEMLKVITAPDDDVFCRRVMIDSVDVLPKSESVTMLERMTKASTGYNQVRLQMSLTEGNDDRSSGR